MRGTRTYKETWERNPRLGPGTEPLVGDQRAKPLSVGGGLRLG